MNPYAVIIITGIIVFSGCAERQHSTPGTNSEIDKTERLHRALLAKYPHAQIEHFMWVSTNPDEYEIKAHESALTRMVVMKTDGTILDDKALKQIPMEELPCAVKASLQQGFPGKRICNPKRVLHNGMLEYYAVIDMNEFTPADNGKGGFKHLHEVYVYPGGRIRNTVSHWKGEPWAARLLTE
jgi:hypothetical protein